MPTAPRVVLTIAGFDPSSGAGVTADVKTISAHRCHVLVSITALTVQSSQGVRRVEPVAPFLVHETLETLISDSQIDAVHIGMLGNGGVAKAVAEFLERHPLPHVVLDPVIKSSSGADLLDSEGVQVLKSRLLPLVEVITPNIDEASALTGLSVGNVEEMRCAAKALHSLGAKAVVITGGHLDPAVDVLSYQGDLRVFESPQIQSTSTHGTGCAFSTALACRLAQGVALPEAVRLAKEYVTSAITHAYPMGKGKGPLNYLFEWIP
jgi:hydroxymethylpyrimidine/phosphomethylpyrimidine kinase